MAHPDVTPVAFRALSSEQRYRLRPTLIRYLARTREGDGTWPAYWWRARHYSTFHNARLARDLGVSKGDTPVVVSSEDSRAVHSAFDLVFVTGTAHLNPGLSQLAVSLTDELLRQQETTGHWEAGENLRVTHHTVTDLALEARGNLYADNDHLFTTASAVWLLTSLVPLRAEP
jgi:hypothetical protein